MKKFNGKIHLTIKDILHVLIILQVGISCVRCIVEKIDSKTPSGSNAYIWLIKSPNILSQSINEPTRYSYGLMQGSIISLDLEFDFWEYSEDKDLVDLKNNFEVEYIGPKNETGKKLLKNNNHRELISKQNQMLKMNKRQSLTSGIPLIRFEDLPVTCVYSLHLEEVNSLVGDLNIANSNDIFIGIKWRNHRLILVFKRLIRQLILYWKSIIHYFIPKRISKSIEKKCLDYFSEILRNISNSTDIINNSIISLDSQNKSLKNHFNKEISHQIASIYNWGANKVFRNENRLKNKELKNVFFLLLNSEQLTSLNHSPIQDLALLSLSAIYPRFNISSYIRSVLRIPIKDRKLRLEYKVPNSDRYTLLIVNGDRIPLHIKGKIVVKNPFPLNHLSFERRMDHFVVDFMLTLYIATIVGYLIYSIYSNQALVQTYGSVIYIKFNGLQIIGLILLLIKPICLYYDRLNVITFTQYGNVKFSSWFIPRILMRSYETLFIMYMLLISLGWRVLRDNLLSMEAKLLIGFFTLLFYLGVFEVILGIFQISRYIFQAIASLCIIIATNINTTLLQNTISDQSISPRLGILYNKWEAYSNFKWVFAIFILKPSMLFLCRVFTLQPNGFDDWIYTLFDSMIDFSILLFTMFLFRPFKSLQLFSHVLAKQYTESNNGNNNNNFNINSSNFNNSNMDVSMWPIIM
ncbi:lung seven transmembrane receptor [Cryptosporidium sp. chipmunk genotype I]|uniref:lung seven transmembrane receptor n=1 Tax=Cryptosporidium sp. chipmunk genotype I TaxID=1280935 RepID=UPI00351A2809|nr:lung seven transmembrane receptor [Cryptosporidium sp. chipmunk genotype I]